MRMSMQPPPASNEGEISLLEAWQIIQDGWLVIVAATLLGGLIATVISMRMPDFYQAEITVLPTGGGSGGGGGAQAGGFLGQFGGLASLAGVNLGALRGQAQSGQVLLNSRTFVEEFLIAQGVLSELYPDSWDADANTWKPHVQDPPSLSAIAQGIKANYSFEPIEDRTGAWMLTFEWTDADTAADWANKLIAQANIVARRRDIANAERTVDYLQTQISRTTVVELQRVLYGLLEAEQKTLMLAHARDDYAFEVIDPAIAPDTPSRPKRDIMIITGVVIGAFLGVMLAIGLRLLRTVRDQARVQRPIP